MSEPIVEIINVSRSKVSDETGLTYSDVTFQFDVPVVEYVLMDGGSGHTTGTIIESRSTLVGEIINHSIESMCGTTVQSVREQYNIKQLSDKRMSKENGLAGFTVKQIRQIDANELTCVRINYNELIEGNNRINIYGLSVEGEWSSYNQ